MKKICFTGYRPFKLPFEITNSDKNYLRFYKRAKNLITAQIDLGNIYFISGMAQGADLILTDIILDLKKTDKNIFLECAVPFKGQCGNFTEENRILYEKAIKNCDKLTVLCNSYSINSFIIRNKYMVDSSDIVIAVYDGKSGGTKFTYDYAIKKGKQVILLTPSDNEIYVQTEI